jgi:hypothetical protein
LIYHRLWPAHCLSANLMPSNDRALSMARRFMRGDDRIRRMRDRPLSDEHLDTVLTAEPLEFIDMSGGTD